MAERPVVLFVDDRPEVFAAFTKHLAEFGDGKLSREFDFCYLDCYSAVKQWYQQNRSRFISLIIQDLDFRQLPDPQRLLPIPADWQPPPVGFDPVGMQGIILYDRLRNERIDPFVPVLFATANIDTTRCREFAEYLVSPGLGSCSFVPEDAVHDRYYPGLLQTVDELALRPLTTAERKEWTDADGLVVGRSRRMAYLCREIEKMAPSDAIVLLIGEPGVGKELVARALHRRSPRYHPDDPKRQRPLTVNIAALDQNLANDALFGHEAGAFTDASSAREGIFEAADGSTLFLDEIGDLTQDMQLRLLRVMEYREISRLGMSHARSVDSRIIAATNRTPAEILSNSRPDFVGRLVQHCLIIPGLRDRWENESQRIVEDDIVEMIQWFLAAIARRSAATSKTKTRTDRRNRPKPIVITDVALRFLAQTVREYIAGGNEIFASNIRTLRNIVERAFERAVAQNKQEVTLSEVVASMGMIKFVTQARPKINTSTGASIESVVGSLEWAAVEKRTIEEALKKTKSIADAARRLKINRETLRNRMMRYGLTPPADS